MSRSVNTVHLIGNVGGDPEIRSTQSGSRVARVSLATNRTWADAAGAKREKVEWHSLQVWGKLADVVEQWVKKGDRLYVEGRIEYSKSEKDGDTRWFTNIVVQQLVMLGGAGGKGEAHETEEREEGPPVRTPAAAAVKSGPDDDLPF